MKEFTSTDRWKEYTEIREQVQQTNKINITVLMERFNHSYGVHTYQRMYGCGWDDKTNISHGFDQHAYDGEDFISLDVKYSMYTASVWQGVRTMMKWNSDSEQLELLKQYYQHECVDWLKYFLTLRKADSERRAPEVSVLQRNSSSPVVCHATGFYPSAVTITWLRNGDELDEDVEFGDLLPNEDGTFQKKAILHVTPDEWKKNEYFCVVEHEGSTIWKTKDELYDVYFKILVSVVGVSLFLFICLSVRRMLNPRLQSNCESSGAKHDLVSNNIHENIINLHQWHFLLTWCLGQDTTLKEPAKEHPDTVCI
ncbi:major histocompatibility complex class I-related gene protein-like [Onychostoma macrolepis]|uniref:major histocompatibility complex class I-related gene protein-like n=1 Tax=Onychostoma macrolepis TaxID=369639 RepID=UPI00272964CC|nr:major histocompatibility complex class I-related gene protein-like [Onychostoma macrolepis]